MRETLFRGKRFGDDEWIYWDKYGRITDINGEPTKTKIDMPTLLRYPIYISDLPIINDGTVGEYTGLTDKNGKKIFEGDIVRTQEYCDRPYSAKAKQKRHIGVVEYAVYKFDDGRCYNVEWKVKIANYGKYCCWSWSEFYDCEVIGNIHDNPEMLEVEQ